MGFSGSYGSVMDFGDFGAGFSYSSSDDGDSQTSDDPADMGFWINLRRAQALWLFDNMLVNFSYGSDNDVAGGGTGSANAQTTMALATSLFTHIGIANNTTALLSMGFGYESKANVGNNKDQTSTAISLPTWTFAVESAMTDWATCRMGVNAGYNLSKTTNAGGGASDVTSRGGMDTDFNVGLGFNYGNFNLDMSVRENLFTNPVAIMTGYENLNDNSATATLTYVW